MNFPCWDLCPLPLVPLWEESGSTSSTPFHEEVIDITTVWPLLTIIFLKPERIQFSQLHLPVMSCTPWSVWCLQQPYFGMSLAFLKWDRAPGVVSQLSNRGEESLFCSWTQVLQGHVVVSHSPCPAGPRAPFLQSCSTQPVPTRSYCPGFCQSGCRASHLPLLNFIKSPTAHFSSLTRSIWVAALPSSESTAPPNLVSPTNLLRGHSVPSSRSLPPPFPESKLV